MMRLNAVQLGFFEDYEDEEALEVGISGIDDAGVRRSFSIQRSTYQPDEQEIRSGMDSYNVSTERGLTVYGCLRRVHITGAVLTLEFTAEDAEVLEVPTPVKVDLSGPEVDDADLAGKLRDILDWGAREKRPELIGFGASGPVGCQ
ncbi:Imm10 family immunity protein [Saccharothrix sp. NRRL B-16314]|uniref:Imm10 family immunity protein n=1 Tax=Saccharothrix sp. NRRL B-16314 TaxID=1463825 RepID=UPI0018CBF64B|nr:Imm10 family immunity protein [Saccharothrix sp. NRRL B-16314]